VASVIGNCEYHCTAQAIRECRLLFIPPEEFRDYLHQRADLCLATVEQLGEELLELTEHAIRPLRLHPKTPKH
jgi:CRP-like cAMP-binding protein